MKIWVPKQTQHNEHIIPGKRVLCRRSYKNVPPPPATSWLKPWASMPSLNAEAGWSPLKRVRYLASACFSIEAHVWTWELTSTVLLVAAGGGEKEEENMEHIEQESPLLKENEWKTGVSMSQPGNWYWTVSIIQGGQPAATSAPGNFGVPTIVNDFPPYWLYLMKFSRIKTKYIIPRMKWQKRKIY